VKPHSTYRLTGWIRTENVTAGTGRGAFLNVQEVQGPTTPPLTGTNDWTLVELEFESADRDAVQVNCLFGGWGLSKGRAWYDDLELELLERRPQPDPFLTVQADRVGAPISEYVYGQFIEHLGRCIYGGLWAEMLADRKFFHAVGSAASPWEVVGPAEALSMSRQEPFVGEHTPEVTLSGKGPQGIAQRGLSLRRGRSYTGHAWVRGSTTAVPVRVRLLGSPDGRDEEEVVPTRGP